MNETATRAFGKPDGWWPRLVCWLLEHDWEICDDVCCESRVRWCQRCLTCESLGARVPQSPFMGGWSHQRGDLTIAEMRALPASPLSSSFAGTTDD